LHSWLYIMLGLSTITSASLLALNIFTQYAAADPSSSSVKRQENGTSEWWFGNIDRIEGKVPFGDSGDDEYTVFRNVKEFGAVGDGVTDDTEAINKAITHGGNRCGVGCDSSTNTPALVYFPGGTYKVSKPLIQYYYTHMVGDLNDIPTIKSSADFEGMAVIDANPYNGENNWFTNQNNFFRQIRNFKIDVTDQPMTAGTGIHWQVAQATSLQNIEFFMIEDESEENAQQGIFMENGSGGFMTDLVFHGGKYGAFFGSQQFTARNLEFNNCNTAIYQIWNWVWNYHGLTIKNCGIGLDLTSGETSQTVGTVIIQDSTFSDTPVGVATIYDTQQTGTNGTLILDNVDFSSGVEAAVRNTGTKEDILEGGSVVASFVQGRSYTGSNGEVVQGIQDAPTKPAALLDSDGKFVVRSKPQYADVPASKFISVHKNGAKGDGKADDTEAIQTTLDNLAEDEIAYFPHGAYIITDTIVVPSNAKLVGEIWPLLMAGGDTNFQDQTSPKVMLQMGKPGDVGNIEMSDFMIETKGPQPGAILMEWNLESESKGSAGLWDVHFRIGGSAGTELSHDVCAKNENVTTTPDPKCIGAFMLMHVTKESSIYMENTWLWVSDHELDQAAKPSQINIYNGRGILIESTKGAWLYGTASEHNVLYNYHLQGAQNVYMTVIQTETAYMQGNPDATVPFDVNPDYYDPDFSNCDGPGCAKTWGLRVFDSSDIFFYGGGMYSFFENYAQDCLDTEDCQQHMVDIVDSDIHMYGVNTKASVNVISANGEGLMTHLPDNESTFCAALAFWQPGTGGGGNGTASSL
jgi:glucan 1,3-beta-glucosidase